jgi:isocitrate dehydrogenase kinase/phosphatase
MRSIDINKHVRLLRCGVLLIALLSFIFLLTSFRATNTSSNSSGDVEAVDQEVNNFMHKYNVPGLSIAITKDNKLVYANLMEWLTGRIRTGYKSKPVQACKSFKTDHVRSYHETYRTGQASYGRQSVWP